MCNVPAGMKSWVIPSVGDIFIVEGVDVISGVDVNTISVGGTTVSDGADVFVEFTGTTVVVVFWQAANMRMEIKRIIFFMYIPVRHTCMIC